MKSFHRSFRATAGIAAIFLALACIGAAKDLPAAPAASPTQDPAVFPLPSVGELLHAISSFELGDTLTAPPAHSPTIGSTIASPRTRILWMQVTAYCPCTKCCGPHAIGLTASGKNVNYNGGRFVAADTALLPFGTKLSVPGYHDGEPIEVIDRGSAIRGYRLDVFFPTHEQAVQWGRRWMAVTFVN